MKRGSSSSSSSSSSDANGIYTRTRLATSLLKRRRGQDPVIAENDFISKLPNDLLQVILSRISTAEAARTSVLSSRWVGVWRCRPDLVLDMRTIARRTPREGVKRISKSLATSLTKVMDNHIGDLESCTIYLHSYQSKDGTVERWIQTAIHEKNTKALTLENNYTPIGRIEAYGAIIMAPNTFSQQSLTSLSLRRFIIPSAQCFMGCSNLKTLKLVDIIVDVNDLSGIIAACSSLVVLLLQIIYLTPSGVLRIKNNNLKYLQMTTHSTHDRIEVHALGLEVLDIRCDCCDRWDNFILFAPNLKFKRNYSNAGVFPHLSCNISYLTQEKKSVWYELLLSGIHCIKRYGSLSVSIDMNNPKEVDVLKEVLLMWVNAEMEELEIWFKNNPKEEGECSNGVAPTKLLEKPFPDADFRVVTVWLFNFSGWNKKELELASQFVTQKTVTEELLIKTYTLPPLKRLEVEAAVDKLEELPKGNEDLVIRCI